MPGWVKTAEEEKAFKKAKESGKSTEEATRAGLAAFDKAMADGAARAGKGRGCPLHA